MAKGNYVHGCVVCLIGEQQRLGNGMLEELDTAYIKAISCNKSRLL